MKLISLKEFAFLLSLIFNLIMSSLKTCVRQNISVTILEKVIEAFRRLVALKSFAAIDLKKIALI